MFYLFILINRDFCFLSDLYFSYLYSYLFFFRKHKNYYRYLVLTSLVNNVLKMYFYCHTWLAQWIEYQPID